MGCTFSQEESQEQQEQQEQGPHMTNKALLIGINYIGTDAQLSGCINDVTNMKSVLMNQYKVPESNIRLLSDDQAVPTNVPTKKNIIDGMKWLIQDAQPGDTLFLHYSGHGGQINDGSKDEEDGLDECIFPSDYILSGRIIDDEIRPIITNIPANCTITCLFDSCHSATVCDLRYKYLQTEEDTVTIKKFADYPDTKGTVIVFSGCEDNDTSADTSAINPLTNTFQAQGAMTFSLIRALVDSAYNIKYKTLLSRMRRILIDGKYTQVPQLTSGNFINLDDPVKLL